MRQNISLCLILLLWANTSQATDRVVSTSGTYNTISAAVAASADGDRVLVEPGNYPEVVAISRSISLLCNQEGARFSVQQLRLSGADGKTILVSGMRALDNVAKVGSYTSRTTLRMVDSYARTVQLVDPNIRVELFRDTVQSIIIASSAMVVGCHVPAVAGTAAAILISGVSALPDEVHIVGNAIGYLYRGSIGVSSDVLFHVENNFITVGTGSESAVSITRTGPLATPRSEIVNNTFYKPSATAAAFAVDNVSLVTFGLLLKNNAMINFTGGLITGPGSWVQLVQSHNAFAAASWINTATGAPSNGSPLIDAGDPDPRYLDLDLTRNDAGCYGGSNSRANFTTPMGSAVVGFLQAPRVVAQGEPVNISVIGFDR